MARKPDVLDMTRLANESFAIAKKAKDEANANKKDIQRQINKIKKIGPYAQVYPIVGNMLIKAKKQLDQIDIQIRRGF